MYISMHRFKHFTRIHPHPYTHTCTHLHSHTHICLRGCPHIDPTGGKKRKRRRKPPAFNLDRYARAYSPFQMVGE